MIKQPSINTFKGISPAEFFYRNRQMAGFGNPTQALYTTVRELVENSLDSCEEAGVFPELDIDIRKIRAETVQVSISDNGTGIPSEIVPDAFGKVLYGSKYDSRQRRGTFGLGVTMSVLYGQISTDSAALIHTKTANDEGTKFRVFVDVEKNAPIVESEEAAARQSTGTSVTVTLNGNLKRAHERILEYLRLTGISTPYAKLNLTIHEENTSFGGRVNELPKFPSIAKPHPHSADMELLRRLADQNPNLRLQEFLIESFQQVGSRKASKFLKFLGMSSTQIVGTLSRKDMIHLSQSLRKYTEFGRPSADCLSPIGKNPFLSSIKSEYQTTSVSYTSRGPLVWDGFPYIIEGVLAIGNQFPKKEIPSLFRFANRVPLLYDSTDDIFTKILKRVSWIRYDVSERNPVALFVHFCSSRVPYSAAGKQSIASVANIEREILSLYRDLGRRLHKLVAKEKHAGRYQKKRREFSKTFKQLTEFSSNLAGVAIPPTTETMIEKLFEVTEDV
ncbi:MAG: DNA topoisomerase VI subunit B [Candidatus Thorarchaeota archaeon]|jgi:DNA topoisomerase-6 subunit B